MGVRRKVVVKKLTGKARLSAEIVEMARVLHRQGYVTDEALEKTTITMLGRDGLPKVPTLTAKEIAKVRESAGVSQAVMAGYLNVSTSTVSQWERGDRRPTGTALKLLNIVKRNGLQPLR